MRFLKVLGLLLIVAVGCRALLLLIGYPPAAVSGRAIGEIAGGAMMIFVVAAIAAGIAALITRRRGDDLPGLSAGFVVALALTAMVYAGG